MTMLLKIRKFFQPDLPFLKVFPPLWLFIFVILIVTDLSSKKWMTDHLNFQLAPHQRQSLQLDRSMTALYDSQNKIDLVGEDGSIAKFRLVFNDRFVFGSGPAAPVLGFFLTLAAVFFLIFYRWNNPALGHTAAWLMVFSGAFGNLIDKMFVKSLVNREWVFSIFPLHNHVSGVVDFIELIWFGWDRMANYWPLSFLAWPTWPTFNIADSLIVVGIGLLILTMQETEIE